MLLWSNKQVGKAGGDKWKSMSDAVSNWIEIDILFSCVVEIVSNYMFSSGSSFIFQEKAPYINKAEKRKTEYNKSMQAYNKRIVCSVIPISCPIYILTFINLIHVNCVLFCQAEGGNGAEEEESDKSKSEVNDDEEDDDESGEVCEQVMVEVCNSS